MEIAQEIEKVKSGLNSQRTDFTKLETNNFRVTPYWLLGFVEGEGSFFISTRDNLRLVFSLSQYSKDLALMKEIRNLFKNLAPSTFIDMEQAGLLCNGETKSLGNHADAANLYTAQRKIPCSDLSISISQNSYIANVLIPFFDTMT